MDCQLAKAIQRTLSKDPEPLKRAIGNGPKLSETTHGSTGNFRTNRVSEHHPTSTQKGFKKVYILISGSNQIMAQNRAFR